MPRSHRETRLGSLLLEKGIITFDQLNQALEVQTRRIKNLPSGAKPQCQLGEILVTLGYVEPKQISRCLKKQGFLRKVAMTFAIAAPLLSLGAPAFAGKRVDTAVDPAAASTQQEQGKVSAGLGIDPDIDTQKSAYDSVQKGPWQEDNVLSGTSSGPFINTLLRTPQSPARAQQVQVEIRSIKRGESQAGNRSIHGSVCLDWEKPLTRDDGEMLHQGDIGGYCLAYRKEGETKLSSFFISDPSLSHYEVAGLAPGNYKFYIAAYDTDGRFGHYSPPISAQV